MSGQSSTPSSSPSTAPTPAPSIPASLSALNKDTLVEIGNAIMQECLGKNLSATDQPYAVLLGAVLDALAAQGIVPGKGTTGPGLGVNLDLAAKQLNR
jgi:hypothetical protein